MIPAPSTEIIVPEYSERSPSFQRTADWLFRSEEGFRRMIDFQKKRGKQFMQENSKGRQNEKLTTIDGLGQEIAEIPLHFFLKWAETEPGCWKDKQFVKEFIRDNPEVKSARPQPKKTLVTLS